MAPLQTTFIVLLSLLSLDIYANELQSISSIRETAFTFAEANSAKNGTKRIIEIGNIDNRLRLPACAQALTAFSTNIGPLQSNTTIGVHCEDERKWTLYIPVSIKIFERVMVLSKPLARGAHITPSDVIYAEQDIQNLKRGYITDANQLQGMLLKRSLPAGSPLNNEVLAHPQLVKRGQRVTLLAKNESLSIRITGDALSSGAIGDMVRVRNLASKRIIEGVVVAAGTVEISF